MDLRFLRRRRAGVRVALVGLALAGGLLMLGSVARAQVDTTAPQLTYTSPVPNGAVTAIGAVNGTVQDDVGGSGVDRVEIGLFRDSDRRWWNGSTWVDTFVILPSNISGNTWTLTGPMPTGAVNLPGGTYVFAGAAIDNSENRGTADDTFTVDRIAPATINFTAPVNGSFVNRFVAVNGNVGDNPASGPADSGIATVGVTIRRNSDNNFWTGTAWSAEQFTLAAVVTGNFWSLNVPFPSGANALDGTYTLTAVASDRAGNQSQAAVTITLIDDVTAPVLTTTIPAANSVTTALRTVGGAVTEEVGGSGLNNVALGILRLGDNTWWNGTAWVATFTTLPAVLTVRGGATFWSRTAGLPAGANLADGQYVLAAVAFDRIGNRRQLDTTVRIDRTAPATLTFTSPANGARVGALAPLTGAVSDGDGGGIARVILTIRRSSDGRYWNGSAWVVAAATLDTVVSGNIWTRTGGPSGPNLVPGTYLLSAVAFDVAGNRRSAVAGVRVVDAVAPTMTIAAPLNGQLLGNLPAITGTIADNIGGSGLRGVFVLVKRGTDGRYWNGTAWVISTFSINATITGTNWTVAANRLPTGANLLSTHYFITAIGIDLAGNRATVPLAVRVINDAVGPTITFARPANGASVRAISPVSGTAVDNVGGSVDRVALAIFRVSDELWWSGTAWTDTFAALPATLTGGSNWGIATGLPSGANLPSGLYVLIAQATDRVGNTTSRDNTIAVDPNAPANNSVARSASTASAQADTDSVRIAFNGVLDEVAGDAATYNISVNGQTVSIDSVQVAGGTVTLSLASGSLDTGDTVEVGWGSGSTTVTAR